MKPAKILLPVQDRPDMETIGKTAFALARNFGARLEGVYAYRPPSEQIQLYYEAGAPMFHGSLLEEAEARSKDSIKRAGEIFERLAGSHDDVASAFVTMKNGVMAGVAERARISDLIVIGTEPADSAAIWMDIRDAAIFQSGRPVIVAPTGAVSADLGRTLVVGWKDSVEAARALFAAGPFLAAADSVRVIAVGRNAATDRKLKDVQAYLALHARHIEAQAIDDADASAEEVLLAEAGKHPDAMLVMGAYSQWRWKEWVFGGVTEYILGKASVPVLMAH